MKAVILAGSLGTRISEETHLKPKPMIEIGGKPILFRMVFLRRYYLYLNNSLACYGEGLFVHAISLTGTGVYVAKATHVYRRHKNNVSSTIPAKKLLPLFLQYSLSALEFFATCSILTRIEKTKIIFFHFTNLHTIHNLFIPSHCKKAMV